MQRVLIAFALFALVALPAVADEAQPKKYTAKELEEIVGPVALYPDQVLSSVLPATTAPLDVLKAARWLAAQKGEVKGAPENSDWDPSVQALVQFPDVLQWMSENLDWMEQMGYAVAHQESDVLGAVQAFRKKAKDTGNLESNDKQKIVVEKETQVIYVQPAKPEVIYVPQYNPVYVTQPVHTHPPSYAGHFWAGFTAGVVGAWAFHEIGWGHHHGHGHYGSIHVHKSAHFNYNRSGQINRTNFNNVNRTNINKWQPSRNNMRIQPTRPPRGPGGKVGGARTPTWNQRRSPAQPARGGMRAPVRRPPTGGQPRPGFGTGRRPSPSPSVGGGRSRIPEFGSGQRPGTRPTTRPDRRRTGAQGRSGLGGSRSGSTARRNSQRGRSSLGSGRSRSGGRSLGGRSRSGGGRSLGGRSGGGRSRGGGGRRR
ncbi:MAG: DUF3300 domain-containing protein [Planctomycetota bacterium]|nr:DUF3300 domain-containing protein [Planctomycetota bacterium]